MLASYCRIRWPLCSRIYWQQKTQLRSEPDFQRWTSGPFQDLPEPVIEYLAKNAERNEMIVNHYVQFKKKYGKTIIFADRWFQCVYLKAKLIEKGVAADAVYTFLRVGAKVYVSWLTGFL